MDKTTAATILVVSALIGYLLLRFTLPALQIERLIFLAILVLAGLIVMLLHYRQKNKPTS